MEGIDRRHGVVGAGGISMMPFSIIHTHRRATATRFNSVVSPSENASEPDMSIPRQSGLSDIRQLSSQYRRAFPWAGITFPANQLRNKDVAQWVREHGHAVDVSSGDELTLAAAKDFRPARIVLHGDDTTSVPVRRAAIIGVGRYVIGSAGQAALLASCAQQTPRVLADITGEHADQIVDAILASYRLNLIGLHSRLESSATQVDSYTRMIWSMVAQMARIRRDEGIILTRICLAGGTGLANRSDEAKALSHLSAAIESNLEDACAKFRFPRPALILAPQVGPASRLGQQAETS
jgi:diaminopimelate decarboxylase